MSRPLSTEANLVIDRRSRNTHKCYLVLTGTDLKTGFQRYSVPSILLHVWSFNMYSCRRSLRSPDAVVGDVQNTILIHPCAILPASQIRKRLFLAAVAVLKYLNSFCIPETASRLSTILKSRVSGMCTVMSYVFNPLVGLHMTSNGSGLIKLLQIFLVIGCQLDVYSRNGFVDSLLRAQSYDSSSDNYC